MSGHSYEHGAMTIGVARVGKFGANKLLHTEKLLATLLIFR
jgi:hypothetical protein